MKTKLPALLLLCAFFSVAARAEAPLRVFIRSGPKTHGPGAHDHPSFLKDWVPLLNSRGAKADGSLDFPTEAQLANTDVLILDRDEGGDMSPEEKAALEKFVKRGGGLVVLHAATVTKKEENREWYKNLTGGAWRWGTTKWFEGKESLYFTDRDNPVTRDCSNFDMDDEIYYDMDLADSIRILAAAYTPNPSAHKDKKSQEKAAKFTEGGKKISVYDIQPQMWMYENKLAGGTQYRAFVSIPGHLYENFSRPNYRAILLRGIAWAGRRANADELCAKDELASLRYPKDGPSKPAGTLAKTVVHPDFKMSLVASEPLINKVINVDWDPAGRMWVVETPEYPNGRRLPNEELKNSPWKDSGSMVHEGDIANRPAHDRISILSDPDEHGVFQKKHVFYEGLELATSMVFYKDGVIVSQAPDILWLRDTKGTGVADTVTKLYTGLGTGDTHAVINNLRWGMDGWIYATLGYSAGDPVSAVTGEKFGHMGAGVVRFLPDGKKFEQFCAKNSNTWGLDISWDNEVFFTQPTCGQVFMHVVVPESVLARGKIGNTASWKANVVNQKTYPLMTYDQQQYVQIDQVGMFTAAAGCAIYDGGTWPEKWNRSYFVGEPTINIVNHEFTIPNGVTFDAVKEKGREETEFMQGKDYWWRPIEVRIGPDGALYVVDFYNQAVIHNDTRGVLHGPAHAAVRPDRDHYFGRVWRVDHKDAKKIAVPDLSKASGAQLVAALEHPNRHVRNNALRLLIESGKTDVAPALKSLVASKKSAEAKVCALWTLARLNQLDDATVSGALADGNAAVRKNALDVIASQPASTKASAAVKLLDDSDARVRLAAIVALGNDAKLSDDSIRKLVALFAKADDDWTKSAIASVATTNPAGFLNAALAAADPEPLKPLVTQLSASLANAKDPASVAKAVAALAAQPASADALKVALLSSLANANMPEWTPTLSRSLAQLIASQNSAVAASALPLAAAWDRNHELTATAQPVIKSLLAKLNDANVSSEERGQIAAGLIGARALNAEILPAVSKLVGSKAVPEVQSRIVTALGDTGDASVGAHLVAVFPSATEHTVREALLNQIVKHTDWSLALVDAIKARKISLSDLGPVAVGRLRNHADKKVSEKAIPVIDELRGPQLKAKDDLIAKFMPVVMQPGNVANGKNLFEQNCLVCHFYKGAGRKEFAPDLTGMGLHGQSVLTTRILDPNREVDPGFLAWDVQTKNGDSFNGILVSENAGTLLLRNAGGDAEIKKSDIAARRNTGLSPMPEGFEALGAENVRDIIAYLMSDTGNFRVLDLSGAFTADTRRGLYANEEATGDSLAFKKFGIVQVKGVPFQIVDPAKSANGKNIVVLKGGGGKNVAHTMPQRVEVKVGFAASRLHFLGGVAGWGHPLNEGKPAMKATVIFSDGQKEEIAMQNGEEFADYIRVVDVPGSELADGLVDHGHQVRVFTKILKHDAPIDRVVLETFDNGVAATTVAITAEIGAGSVNLNPAENSDVKKVSNTLPAPSAKNSTPVEPLKWNAGIKVLVIGGGTSHDFDKYFNKADTSTLGENKKLSINYTDNPAVALAELPKVDVFVSSTNQPGFDTPEMRKALFDFVGAGKGLVLVHPGTWYAFPKWAEYNRELVGGGSRGHDAIAEFEVKIANAQHPVTAGVSPTFKITDELYNMIADPQATPIEVLATATSPKSGKTFPSVWIVKHPKAHIVCIAPGHDARAHDLPEYKKLLQNAVAWAAGK